MSLVIQKVDPYILAPLKPYLLNHRGFVAGGAFKDFYTEKSPKDIDIFFRRPEHWTEAELLFGRNSKQFKHIYTCDKSVCYEDRTTNTRLELIRARFGTPGDIISKIDFTVAQFAYYFDEETEAWQIIRNYNYFEHLGARTLVIEPENLIDPVNTFERAFRYKGYGFELDRASKKKLIQQLQGVDPDSLRREFNESL